MSIRMATVAVPEITSDVLSGGLVVTYILSGSSNASGAPTPLPYTWKRYTNFAFNKYYLGTYGSQILAGAVNFFYYPTDATDAAPEVFNLAVPPQTFKVYILSGAAVRAASARHVNLNSPQAIQQFSKTFR